MDPDYKFLVNTFSANKIDYKKIKEENIVIIQTPEEAHDISLIIPVRGRVKFLKPTHTAFKSAIDKSGLNVAITVVEHSELPEHSHFCKQNKLSYIWIKSESGKPFNKCLAMNTAVIFGPRAKYLMFHDLDCLVQSNFFNDIMSNISSKNCKAIQCFHGRRVLYLNDDLTNKVINGEIDVDIFKLGMLGINLPYAIGAPGGSIMVDKNLFFDVGGYDPELFYANAPEDIFFWNKINELSKMEVSDSPEIDIFHMNHPVTYNDNPRVQEMLTLSKSFSTAKPEERLEFIKIKRDILKEFSYE
jgi:predicted glycosyltransferase involved in capsule biosynthesis